MDIVTHTLSGVVLAAPFIKEYPVASVSFVFGMVLPDLDALSRLFGKKAFMTFHQSYTHSLFFVALISGFVWLLTIYLGLPSLWAVLAMGAGILLHMLMDLQNSYGLLFLWPMTRERYCFHFIFFIDTITIVWTGANAVGMGIVYYQLGSAPSVMWAVVFALVLCLYWLGKSVLFRHARSLVNSKVLSLVPSALWPWSFYGTSADSSQVTLWKVNLLRKSYVVQETLMTHDIEYATMLEGVGEYTIMRRLFSAYRTTLAVEDENGTTLECQELGVRNFGGKFGRLTLRFDSTGRLMEKQFDV